MKNRGTAALIALFFAGLVGLWFADSWQIPGAAERERMQGKILTGLANLRPDDLRRIEIEAGADQPTLVFERRGGQGWQMTAPIDVAANPSLVEGLALTLKGLTRKPQADTLDGDPQTYGLAPPARTIRLWGAATDVPLATLAVSKPNLDRRFVRVGAAGVEVVPARGLELVDLPPVRWRDRELFRVPTFEVDSVSLTTGDRRLRFDRGPDAWRIVEPIRAFAEGARVEGLIASLGSLRITADSQFVADDVAAADRPKFGLAPPRLTVSVRAGRGNARRPEQVLDVGGPVEGQPDHLYARLADQDDVVSVDARVLGDIIRSLPNDYRAARVADIAPNRATKLQVTAGRESFEVARSGNSWFLIRPSIGRADPKAVQEFFQALEGLRTGLYLPPSPATEELAGLASPSEVIQVWQSSDPSATEIGRDAGGPTSRSDQGEKPTFAIRIGNRDAGKKIVYAQVEGDTTILALPESMTANLFRQSWAFRDRLVLAAPTEQIERIQIDGLGKSVTLQAPVIKIDSFKNAATGWWMSAPVVAQADPGAMTKLLKLLGGLRVDGYAAEGPPSLAAFGLDEPTFKLTYSIPAGLPPSPVPLPPASDPRTRLLRLDEQSLLVGDLVPGRRSARYAMLAGQTLVFILGGEALATLDSEWHDHQILKFDPGAVDRIHLAWPESSRAVDLERSDRGWSIVGPIDIPGLDPAAADSIVAALANLTTARYLQYAGQTPPTVGLTPPRLDLKLSGPSLSRPVLVSFGGLTDADQGFAAVPESQPGAVFLVPSKPFLLWLQLQSALRDGLPVDVFQPEPPEPAIKADLPGQTTAQPR